MPGAVELRRVDPTGQVVEVAEKSAISNYTSTGLYYFASGCGSLKVASGMLKGQHREEECYTIPVYHGPLLRGWYSRDFRPEPDVGHAQGTP